MQKSISIAEHTQFANMVTRVAVEHEDKYLMVQEGKAEIYGLWAFPGGKVDVGESISDSAIREIREETAMEVELVGIIGLQPGLWSERSGFTFEVNFLGKAISVPDTFPISEEVLAVEWKSKEEIARLALEGKLRNKGQEAIVQMLDTGDILPILAMIDGAAMVPPEVR